MKARAIGILCLISGVLAVPLEQAQNSQQVEPQQAAPAEAAEPFFPGFPEDSEFDAAVPEEGEGEDEGEGDAEGEGEGDEEFDPEMMMMETGNVDMEAFEQMVNEVQGQVEAINQLVKEHGSDTEGLMKAIVDPMSKLNETLAVGVQRLVADHAGNTVNAVSRYPYKKYPYYPRYKKRPITLLGDLLRTVSSLLEGLLTRGPLGGLVNGLLGGILSGVVGTIGPVVVDRNPNVQIPQLLSGFLG